MFFVQWNTQWFRLIMAVICGFVVLLGSSSYDTRASGTTSVQANAAPAITSVVMFSGRTLVLNFDQKITLKEELSVSDFSIDPTPSGFTAPAQHVVDPDGRSIQIVFPTIVFDRDMIYKLRITNTGLSKIVNASGQSITPKPDQTFQEFIFVGVRALTPLNIMSTTSVDANTIDIRFNKPLASTIPLDNTLIESVVARSGLPFVAPSVVVPQMVDASTLRVFFPSQPSFTEFSPEVIYEITLNVSRIQDAEQTLLSSGSNVAIFLFKAPKPVVTLMIGQRIGNSVLSFSALRQQRTLPITAKGLDPLTTWNARSDVSWVGVDKNGDTLTLHLSKNITKRYRNGTVTVRYGSMKRTIKVVQKPCSCFISKKETLEK